MGKTNIFWNAYVQPENKLTYNFLCLLEHTANLCGFAEYLLDYKYSFANEKPKGIETVYGGYESNPDGMMMLSTVDGQDISVYLENKTHRYGLEESQLQNHLRLFCCQPNKVLLVITPRLQDYEIVSKLNNSKVFFKTWQQVVAKLAEINKQQQSFMVSQFIEYGHLSGECILVETVGNREISDYLRAKKSEAKEKFYSVFESLRQSIDFSALGLLEADAAIQNHWGRFGLEFKFKPKYHNYGQWFFFGIYYDAFDHGLKFKQPSLPEVAFFFDINPKEQEALRKKPKLLNAIRRLCDCGFEDNLTFNVASAWRMLFWRRTLDENENLSSESLKQTFLHVYNMLIAEKDFAETML